MTDRAPLWPKILGYVLWAISAIIGVGALFAAIGLVEAAVPRLFLNCDPMKTVECSGQARALMILGYSIIGIAWLIWYIVMAERYTRAKSPETVAKRFAVNTGIQAAIIIVWYVLTELILG
ncbi:MAG: hypothetical protein GXX94_08595 [Chloroflexi bacterium]|nr:hypothetical protein [Chloroflexota bacterium]